MSLDYDALFAAHAQFEEPWKGEGRTAIEWAVDNWSSMFPPIGQILRARMTLAEFLHEENFPIVQNWVYFLMEGWTVFYVGRTRNPDWRFRDHLTRWPALKHLSVLRVPEQFVEEVEGFYIDLLTPPENVKRGEQMTIGMDLLDHALRHGLYGPEPVRFKRCRSIIALTSSHGKSVGGGWPFARRKSRAKLAVSPR